MGKIRIRTILLVCIVLLALASIFPFWVSYHSWQFLNDDTYITLTYAKSLAAGKGFVFNQGPTTLGTTTPLFTLIIAALAAIIPQVEIAKLAVVFTAVCWACSAWVILLFRHKLNLCEWQACMVGLAIIATGRVDSLGMETHFFNLLLLLSIVLFLCHRPLEAGVCIGLLFLTRGEGALLLVPLGSYHVVVEWKKTRPCSYDTFRPLLQMMAGFLIPVLFWSIYSLATFGSLLPNTLAAKMAQGRSGLWKSLPTRLIFEWIPSWGTQFAIPGLPFLNIWWLMVITGFVVVLVRNREWVILLSWLSLYVIGYTLLGVSAYNWYQNPIVFIAQIFAALGIFATARAIARLRFPPSLIRRALSVFVCVLFVGLLAQPQASTVLGHSGDPRGPTYLAISRWFRENAQPSQRIAFIEIGYLGYFTDNQIIDLAGLTMPDIANHIGKSDFAWGFWQYNPDYYVFTSDFDWALADIRTDPRFERYYRPVVTVVDSSSSSHVIYERTADRDAFSSSSREEHREAKSATWRPKLGDARSESADKDH